MSSIMTLENIEKTIGEGRAEVVRKFIGLVNSSNYREAREFYQKLKRQEQADIKVYAPIYLREASKFAL